VHCIRPLLFYRSMGLQKSTLAFLRALKKNNNREWFAENKPKYIIAQQDMIQLMDELLITFGKIDDIPEQDSKKAIFRIYRDVRFSKNKAPYKAHFSGVIRRGPGKISMYVHAEPGGGSIIGTGIWQPSPELLAAVRQEIDYNGKALQKTLNKKTFKDAFGDMRGDTLKTAPKGYPKDHQYIELLRHKSFFLSHSFTDIELQDKNFAKLAATNMKKAKDFMAFFDAPLTEIHEKKK
jgi:uncharacterized protein (TIGR02453 family)